MSRQLSQVATFSLDVPTQVWTFSEELQKIYGFPAEGSAEPALLLQHMRPQDAQHLILMLKTCARTGGAVALPHPKIFDDGSEIWTCTLAQGIRDHSGQIRTITGYVVDLTDAARQRVNLQVRDELTKALESRATIDQAKGMIRLAYGMGEDEAFTLLGWVSQRSQVKLRVLAEQVVDRVGSRSATTDELRGDLDSLLHQAMRTTTTLGKPTVVPVEEGEVEPEGFAVSVHRSEMGASVRLSGVLSLAASPTVDEAMKQACQIARQAHRESGVEQRVRLDLSRDLRLGPFVRDLVAEWDERLTKNQATLMVFDGTDEMPAQKFLESTAN